MRRVCGPRTQQSRLLKESHVGGNRRVKAWASNLNLCAAHQEGFTHTTARETPPIQSRLCFRGSE